jgi:hypothetical protein
VTHFMILSNPKSLPHLRMAKTPQGPTYTFQIEEYALAADIANSQKRPRCPPGIFKNPPLVCAVPSENRIILSRLSLSDAFFYMLNSFMGLAGRAQWLYSSRRTFQEFSSILSVYGSCHRSKYCEYKVLTSW